MKFRLVDKITDFRENEYITGEKALSLEEYFLLRPSGHKDIFPPTLMAESLFQLANFLIFKSFKDKLGNLVMFKKILFHDTMHPGDILVMRIDITSVIDDAVMLNGSGKVNGKPVIEGVDCMAKLFDIQKLVNPVKYGKLFENLFTSKI